MEGMGGGGGGDAAIEERGYVWQEGRSQNCARRRLDFEMQNNGVNQHLSVAPTSSGARRNKCVRCEQTIIKIWCSNEKQLFVRVSYFRGAVALDSKSIKMTPERSTLLIISLTGVHTVLVFLL